MNACELVCQRLTLCQYLPAFPGSHVVIINVVVIAFFFFIYYIFFNEGIMTTEICNAHFGLDAGIFHPLIFARALACVVLMACFSFVGFDATGGSLRHVSHTARVMIILGK